MLAAIGSRVNVDVGVLRGRQLTLHIDGEPIVAFEGETVAGALMASGKRALRTTAVASAPRGVFCGMGVCHECLMTIEGRPSRRACMVEVRDGMQVRTQAGAGEP